MRIIRYRENDVNRLAAVTDQDKAYPLAESDWSSLSKHAETQELSLLGYVNAQIEDASPLTGEWTKLALLTPIDAPEVWAAGVTYERSKQARNYEASEGRLDALTFYDKVYEATRPELFMKSTLARTVGPGDEVCLRSDSQWQVPEPELGLVIDSQGRIIGYTAGNDMSCRDIEGENPLYLPQAKIWKRSCAIGPAVRLAETVDDPYDLLISCRIYRNGNLLFEDSASTSRLKRKLEELVSYLLLDNEIYDWTVLLTGTCIVPPNEFTLQCNDRIEIEINGIGILTNTAALTS